MASTTLTEQQITKNLKNVRSAVKEQELEGLTVPEETVSDLNRVARGEINTDEVRANIMRRVNNAKILSK